LPRKGQIDLSIRDEFGKIIPWKKRNRAKNNLWRKNHRAAGLEKKPTPEQQKVWQKTHKLKNPRAEKNRQLKYTYGITIDVFDEILKRQNNKCAICNKEFLEDIRIYVDHEHIENGKVRGLLCLQCNTGLGNFQDNTDLLHLAIKYLENNNGNR
jgi:hypothetical protein